MNALDNPKTQGKELGGARTNQFHSQNVEQSAMWQAHRIYQTAHQIKHAKWFSELG